MSTLIFSAKNPGDVKLTTRLLFVYGWLNIPLAVSGLPLAIYIPTFYGTELGLTLSSIGYILLLARIADIIIDPMIGVFSDRTPEHWGRRRLWMIVGIPLMALTTYQVFSPAETVDFWYAFLWISLLYIAWTVVTIPYQAWGAELSPDYGERSLITGWREMFGVVGNFLITGLPALLPFLIGLGFVGLAGATEDSLAPLLHIVAVTTVITLFVALAAMLIWLPEVRMPKAEVNWASGLRIIWLNAPFKRLLLVNIFNGMGWTVCGTLFVPYVLYVLDAGLAATGWLLLFYYFFGIVGAPLMARGGNVIGKHRMWAVTIIFTCFAFAPAYFFGPGDEWIFAFMLCFTGLSIANGGILGSSMSADVIDIDTLHSGEQRGALFMALWGMASKLAAALGAGIALPLLEGVGFRVTEAGVEGLQSLSFLYVALPIIFWFIAAAIVWNYPITLEYHSKIRAEIEARRNNTDGATTTTPGLNSSESLKNGDMQHGH